MQFKWFWNHNNSDTQSRLSDDMNFEKRLSSVYDKMEHGFFQVVQIRHMAKKLRFNENNFKRKREIEGGEKINLAD